MPALTASLSAVQAQPERPSPARGGWREAIEQEQQREEDAPTGPLPGVRSHDFATVQSRAAAVRHRPWKSFGSNTGKI